MNTLDRTASIHKHVLQSHMQHSCLPTLLSPGLQYRHPCVAGKPDQVDTSISQIFTLQATTSAKGSTAINTTGTTSSFRE
jgi:hypothetical protein